MGATALLAPNGNRRSTSSHAKPRYQPECPLVLNHEIPLSVWSSTQRIAQEIVLRRVRFQTLFRDASRPHLRFAGFQRMHSVREEDPKKYSVGKWLPCALASDGKTTR